MKLRAAFTRRVRGCLFSLGAAVVAALLQGCGLETVVLLSSPGSGPPDETAKTFTIYLTTSNDEAEFRGIEIFYKFYSALGSFEGGLATYSDVVAAHFLRLTSLRDAPTLQNLPLIPVDSGDRGKPSTITLDFSPLENNAIPVMRAVPDTTGLTLADTEFRRAVVYNVTGQFKTFYSETDDGFVHDDADISALGLSGGTDPVVYIGLYALSYGLQDLTTPIYSRAVPLSPISIPLHVVR